MVVVGAGLTGLWSAYYLHRADPSPRIAMLEQEVAGFRGIGSSPDREPEPLRWLGINAGLRAMTLADTEERRTGRPSRLARLMAPLTGGLSLTGREIDHGERNRPVSLTIRRFGGSST